MASAAIDALARLFMRRIWAGRSAASPARRSECVLPWTRTRPGACGCCREPEPRGLLHEQPLHGRGVHRHHQRAGEAAERDEGLPRSQPGHPVPEPLVDMTHHPLHPRDDGAVGDVDVCIPRDISMASYGDLAWSSKTEANSCSRRGRAPAECCRSISWFLAACVRLMADTRVVCTSRVACPFVAMKAGALSHSGFRRRRKW